MADVQHEEELEDMPEGDEPGAFEAPPEIECNEASREEQVIEEDATHFNYMLRRANTLWQQNLDAEDYCKLAQTTMKLLEMRRRMMLLRTEREKEKGGKGSFYGAFADN